MAPAPSWCGIEAARSALLGRPGAAGAETRHNRYAVRPNLYRSRILPGVCAWAASSKFQDGDAILASPLPTSPTWSGRRCAPSRDRTLVVRYARTVMRLIAVATFFAASALITACTRQPTVDGARPEPSIRPGQIEPDAAPASTPSASSSSPTAQPLQSPTAQPLHSSTLHPSMLHPSMLHPATPGSVDPPLLADGHACEPIVRCGVWSGCVWLDRLGPGRYRERRRGDKAEVFVRRHECWPADSGLGGCAVHCTGEDAGPPCYDGLHPEEETCTGAAAPKPNSAACHAGDGICGSFI